MLPHLLILLRWQIYISFFKVSLFHFMQIKVETEHQNPHKKYTDL